MAGKPLMVAATLRMGLTAWKRRNIWRLYLVIHFDHKKVN